MGNVIAAQSAPSNKWHNGTLFGKELEKILIKNNTVLQKRACCMGLTSGQPNAAAGLEVPIANVGFNGYDIGESWETHVGANLKRATPNTNPYEDDDVKTQLSDMMPSDIDARLLRSHGMVVRNLHFNAENVPTCSFETENTLFKESMTQGVREYKGYTLDTTAQQKLTSTERQTCDNFMQQYSKQTIVDRQCITTCGDIKDIDDETMAALGFGMVCDEAPDDKKIIDVRKAGCRAETENAFGYDPPFYHSAFHYPNDTACMLSAYGKMYNNGAKEYIGNLFQVPINIQKNVHSMDPYCNAKSKYTDTTNAAYYNHDMLTSPVTCLSFVDIKNVKVNAGRDAEINIRQDTSCGVASNVTDNGTASNADPTTGNNFSGATGSNNTPAPQAPPESPAPPGPSGPDRPPAVPPVPPVPLENPPLLLTNKRTLGLPVDDEIAYGVAGVVGILLFI